MFRVLFLKELREIWWIGLPILIMLLYNVAVEVDFGSSPTGKGYGFLRYTDPDVYHKVPLIDGGFAKAALLWGLILAAILGLWQTFRETQSRTWHFLLYRPVDRAVILGAKTAAAAVVLGGAVILPAIGVILWAATPGAHASPFSWSLTAPVWYAITANLPIYFAALFAGIRRSHLIGSRWWPLIGAIVLFGPLPMTLPKVFAIWVWGLLLLWTVLLVASVRDELRSADFN